MDGEQPVASAGEAQALAWATVLPIVSILLSACVLIATWLLVDALRSEAMALRTLIPSPAEVRQRGPDPEAVHRIDTRGAPSRGKTHAKVTVVEFSDFECPFCRRAAPTLDRLHDEYGDRARFVFKHLPLAIHPRAPLAHAAAEASARQDRFWEMRDYLFTNTKPIEPESLVEAAGALGLDPERFRADADSQPLRLRIWEDMQEAEKLGLSGTPSYFVNGRYIVGNSYEALKERIEAELAR